MDIWEILQLEETSDRNAIRKAYAERAKEWNPEEHPGEFLRLREAYTKALSNAAEAEAEESGSHKYESEESNSHKSESQESGSRKSESEESASGKSGSGEFGAQRSGFRWDFAEENPFQNGEGICCFRELYTGKRRKDPAAWTDYFLTGAFLEGYREKDFARLLLDAVRENAQEYPPCKEFLTQLYIAYGISSSYACKADTQKEGETESRHMEFRVEETAPFPGMEFIMEIARMGPAISRLKGNEPAMAAGFEDYRQLLILARKGFWEDEALIAMGKIINRYGLSDISDRPIKNAYQYDLSQRHPKSLKLITFFFAEPEKAIHGELPDKAYGMLWNRLGLESATNGREKLLYGGLREAVLAHVPEIMGKPKVDINKLNHEMYYDYYESSVSHHTNEGRTPKEREILDQFLAREDVQTALRDESYVDKQISRYWITAYSGDYLLDRLEEFYSNHREISLAGHVLKNIEKARESKRIGVALQEDSKSQSAESGFDIRNRACLRYYLNTAFHLAGGIRSQTTLKEYLKSRMPYSGEWSRRFAGEEEGLSAKAPIQIRFGQMGEDILSVIFHSKYIEYLWNGSPVVPRFPGWALREVEDDNYFWLLAPTAAAPYEKANEICQELTRRLEKLPVQEGDIPVIVDCIAAHICYMEGDRLPVCTFYAQKKDQLFGCDIYEESGMDIYEETEYRNVRLSHYDDIHDLETAVKMGKRLLGELTAERDAREKLAAEQEVKEKLALLPVQVFVKYRWRNPDILTGEDVTQDAIWELLQRYFQGSQGGIQRLELDFGNRALVFLKDGDAAQYACLYFEHDKRRWFGLVGLPEVYEVVDEKDVVYEPFGLGMLPNYLVHRELGLMESELEDIFAQTACEEPPSPAFLMWSSHVYFSSESQQYHLAQRLFGGFPPERACCRLQEQFYVPVLPTMLSYTDLDGNRFKNIDVSRNKELVQAMLARYMGGKLDRLVLNWDYVEKDSMGEKLQQDRYIALVQDQGRHQMFYFESYMGGMQYLTADVEEYLAVKDKKFRKEEFLGRTVPGYLVHKDLRRIRDCLDLLVPEIEESFGILRQFGEFCYVTGEECEWAKKEYLGINLHG